jgi:hypothetical protein
VVEDVPLARLVFPVRAESRLEGVVVRVRQGRITEILAGTVKVKGTVVADRRGDHGRSRADARPRSRELLDQAGGFEQYHHRVDRSW